MVDRYPEYNARHHDAASHLAAEVGIGILTLDGYPPLESDDEAHVCTLLHSLMLEVHIPAVLLPSQVHRTITKVGNRTFTIALDAQVVTQGLSRNRSAGRIKGNQATFDNSQRNNLRSCVWVRW